MRLKNKQIVPIVIIGATILIGIFIINESQRFASQRQVSGGGRMGEETATGAEKTEDLINFDEIRYVLPKDRIPAIDNPKFITAEEADEWLNDDEIVLGLFLDGEARAYPFQILVWHEIVNDWVNDKPVLITECPLCLSGIAFDREIGGEAVEFGTSGKLYRSNLLMYDRKTESYWWQITGQAVVGPLEGMKLKKIPLDTVIWKDWKTAHPDTLVLSQDTGHVRPYGSDPYVGYYTSTEVGFGATFNDTRLHPKAIVRGVEINGQFKAYPDEEIVKVGLVNDEFAGSNLLIVNNEKLNAVRLFDRDLDGRTLEFELIEGKIFDKQTGSEWDFEGKAISGELEGTQLEQVIDVYSFWFSWLNAHPDTELFLVK